MNNISLVMYTNEKYLPIAYLSSIQINKYFNLDIPKYLLTNRYLNLNFNYENFNIFETNTKFDSYGYHFKDMMIKFLSSIDSTYILYFQDDYYLINYFKQDNFYNLLNYIISNDIGFMSLTPAKTQFGNIVNNTKSYNLPDIIELNPSYEYITSTQPCIWNKNLLLQILKDNDYLNLSMLDTANYKNSHGNPIRSEWTYYQKPYSFASSCSIVKNYAFDEHNGNDDYYILLYSEIIRYGKFNTNTHKNNKQIVEQIMNMYDLQNDNRYKIFL